MTKLSLQKLLQSNFLIFLQLIFLLGIFIISGFLIFNSSKNNLASGLQSSNTPEEIAQIIKSKDFEEQKKIVRVVLEKYGPEKTQEWLKDSGLPFTGQTHFLVHEVGDYVYAKYGEDALLYCRDYFLEACYHGVVINTISDSGIPGVKKLVAKCKDAGGNDIYFQCGHAAGHGLMASEDYHLPKALLLCDNLGEQDDYLERPCQQGVFMENVWGVHRGEPIPIEKNPWLSKTDPLYPCNWVDEKYRLSCWSEQATRIYQMFGRDVKKTAEVCDRLNEDLYKKECINNLSRQITTLSGGDLNSTIELCEVLGVDWRNYCLQTNMSAFFSLGDYQTPYLICSKIDTEQGRDECWRSAAQRTSISRVDLQLKRDLCGKIEVAEYKNQCLEKAK